jgi:hypothetical protein
MHGTTVKNINKVFTIDQGFMSSRIFFRTFAMTLQTNKIDLLIDQSTINLLPREGPTLCNLTTRILPSFIRQTDRQTDRQIR